MATVNGTWVGTPTYVDIGGGGKAASIVDVNNVIQFPSQSRVFPSVNTSHTIRFRARTTANDNYNLAFTGDSGGNSGWIGLKQGKAAFSFTTSVEVPGTGSYNDGQWHTYQTCVVANGGGSITARLWVDGVFQSSATGNVPTYDMDKIYIGKLEFGYPWKGDVDFVETYDSALRTTDAGYTESGSPATSGYVHQYLLNGDANDTVAAVLSATATRGATDSTYNRVTVAASAGTGPYAYAWHVSETAGFVPTPGTLIAGATTSTLAHAATRGRVFNYRAVVTDSTVASVTSNQVASAIVTQGRPIVVLFSGDSITHIATGGVGDQINQPDGVGTTAMFLCLLLEASTSRPVVRCNRARSGTGTLTYGSGSSEEYQYVRDGFLAAMAANPDAEFIHLHCTGANDVTAVDPANNSSVEAYKSNIYAFKAALVRDGVNVPMVVNQPPYRNDNVITEAGKTRLSEIADAVGQLSYPGVIVGDMTLFAYVAMHPEQTVDLCHPNNVGAAAWPSRWKTPVLKVLGYDNTPVINKSADSFGVKMISSGTQPIQTVSDAAVNVVAGYATTPSEVTLFKAAGVEAFASLDGGTTWVYLPAAVTSRRFLLDAGMLTLQIKRVAGGTNVTGIYADRI